MSPPSPIPSYNQIQSLLRSFHKSTHPFKLIHSIPSPLAASSSSSSSSSPSPSPSTILILDSSFNPPTQAHAYLIHSAIHRYHKTINTTITTTATSQDDPGRRHPGNQLKGMRILLLLSTTNADKAAVPAGYAHRLQMMMLFAQGLFGGKGSGARELDGDGDGDGLGLGGYGVGDGKAETGIDIAVSAEPRFLEKSVFLSGDLGTGTGTGAGTGNGSGYARAAQWWMLGFDTLRRLVDGKYYRPTGSLGVLAPLFEGAGNRILMVKRNGYAENDDAEQDEFVRALRFGRQEGGFQGEGWNAEWGERVDFVDAFDGGVQDGEGRVVSVSSTAAREGVREGNFEVLRQICGDDVAEYIQKEGLYIEG